MENLNAMVVFVRVAETKSFTAAAKRLGISPSGVSKAVGRVEEELGVRLLNRTTRTVSLTDDGASFFERCRQILAEIEDAETTLTCTRSIPHGRLRVQMPVVFGGCVIVPALAGFTERHPGLTLDVELSDRIVDLAEEGLDATIRIGKLEDSRLIARKLCDLNFVICASPQYLKHRGEPKSPDDLDQHSCLGYLLPHTGRYREWKFAKDGLRFSKAVSGRLNLNNAESLLAATIAGAGIATMASFVAADAIKAGRLVLVLRNYISVGPQVSVVYLRSRHLSPRIQAFVEFLSQVAPSAPPWDHVLSRQTT